MATNYFLNNKLECNKENPTFVGYLIDLKNLFLETQKQIEEGDADGAKDKLMDNFGKLSPNLYKVSDEINDIFVGQQKNEIIEIYLNFRKLYEELSSESINDLTGGEINISANRIKLFLTQELRQLNILVG